MNLAFLALLPAALRQTPPLQRFAALARQYASRLSQLSLIHI